MMVGEISAAESNFNSRKKERIKNKAKGRGNNGSPREFKHQAKVPTWMDRKYVAAYAAEHECSVEHAVAMIFKRDY